MDPYYTPQSIAPILQAGAAQQVPLIQQPKGLAGALPALGNLAQTGFDVASNNQKKKSVLEAQQAYSSYLAKVDAGTATQDDHAIGRMAAMSLGIPLPDSQNADPRVASTLQTAAGIDGAPIRGTKANIAGMEAAARIKKPSGGMSGMGATPEQIDSVAKSFANGEIPAKEFSQMIGRSAPADRYKLFQAIKKYKPDFNMAKSMLDYKRQEAFASPGMVKVAAMSTAAVPVINKIKTLSHAFPRESWQKINEVGLDVAAQTGNQDAQRLKTQIKLGADEIQSIFGTGSDAKLDLAIDLMRASQTTEQLDNSIDQITEALGLRADTFSGKGVGAFSKDIKPPTPRTVNGAAHPQDAAAVSWAKANPNDPRAKKILQLNAQ